MYVSQSPNGFSNAFLACPDRIQSPYKAFNTHALSFNALDTTDP